MSLNYTGYLGSIRDITVLLNNSSRSPALCVLRNEICVSVAICNAYNSEGNAECPGMTLYCGLSIRRGMILIDILDICEKRAFQTSLLWKGQFLGNRPAVYNKYENGATYWSRPPVLRWLPEVWPSVLFVWFSPFSGTSWLRDRKQQHSTALTADGQWYLVHSPWMFIAVHSVNLKGLLWWPRSLWQGPPPPSPITKAWGEGVRTGEVTPSFMWNIPGGSSLAPFCLKGDSVAVCSLWGSFQDPNHNGQLYLEGYMLRVHESLYFQKTLVGSQSFIVFMMYNISLKAERGSSCIRALHQLIFQKWSRDSRKPKR